MESGLASDERVVERDGESGAMTSCHTESVSPSTDFWYGRLEVCERRVNDERGVGIVVARLTSRRVI